MKIIDKLAQEFKIKKSQVEDTVKLMDEGNTIPFIARYRKEATGGLTDNVLRELSERLEYLRNLESRKEEVKRLIDEQGKLSKNLIEEIDKAEIIQRVEDLYKPYKKKKVTRASKAKEKGLEPLAMIFYAQQITEEKIEDISERFVNKDRGVENVEQAISGAKDIIAEALAEDADLTEKIRKITSKEGVISTEAINPEEKTVYDMYYGRKEEIKKIPNHRILAINRGEKEKKLRVKVDVDVNSIIEMMEKRVIRNDNSIFVKILKETVEDSYKRLIAPSVEREMRNLLTERAEISAINVFAKNTENLLMVPPVKDKKVISIDPGYRTGCKVAVLEGTGKLKAYTTIYPTKPKNDVKGAKKTLKKLVDEYGCDVIVIGNGTASRETEIVVSDFIKENNLNIEYTIVNEAGASVYSASKLASEEYPDLDVTTRGAMSLGRRLQDPLAELVKIDPKHIGVGQYQHDINQKLLENALTYVIENCVNRVGVDLNTASPSLLSYVSGINMAIAKNIVSYREENGKFTDRRELLNVKKLGPKAFQQSCGFLRISGGKEPLDSTAVHPESYKDTEKLMKRIGITKEMIALGGVGMSMDKKIMEAYPEKTLKGSIEKMAKDLNIGDMTIKDIVDELKKPGRDPRDTAPPVVFRRDITTFEDLKEGMELKGTVRNVVDFGAFVDIGVKQDGLVHISQLSNKFVDNPMDVVSVGDTVKVKILSVDEDKKKIALTMKF